jgi:hypothetical protein
LQITQLKIASNPFAKGFRDCDPDDCVVDVLNHMQPNVSSASNSSRPSGGGGNSSRNSTSATTSTTTSSSLVASSSSTSSSRFPGSSPSGAYSSPTFHHSKESKGKVPHTRVVVVVLFCLLQFSRKDFCFFFPAAVVRTVCWSISFTIDELV